MTRKWALAVGLGVVALGAAIGTWSAFSATADNTGNSIASGTVALTDNDGGSSAMFSLPGLKPNDTAARCIKVTATGSLSSEVRLYGATSGSGLDPYIGLTITRGSYSPSEPSFSSCTNFVADSTSYVPGQGQGVVYAGTLQDFPDDYASGLVDPPSGAPETWTNNESHVYKFQVVQADNRTAEGKDATQTFTWEARNQ